MSDSAAAQNLVPTDEHPVAPDIYNYHDGIERVARKFIVIPYPIPETCTATYFPETNVLVPISSVAEKSNTPTSKLVVVKVRKSEG